MIKIRNFLITVSALAMLILISCHTETPLGIDNTDPSVELMYVYNDMDTLYNYADTTNVFTDFGSSIAEGDYFFKVRTSDDQELYRLSLIAEDRFTNTDYEISSISDPVNGETEICVQYRDFPVVQDPVFQEFYLKLKVFDESENMTATNKLGFRVMKEYPFNIFFDALGLIKEIQGDSVDFREKNGKLAFVQFMEKGCLSCVEEAQDMKTMYADPAYDLGKYSHSLFGRGFIDEAEFLSFKTRDYKFPFDCFLDNDDTVREVFEQITGNNIENGVFAVLPNGKIEEFNYLETEFPDWIHLMYETAYPEE